MNTLLTKKETLLVPKFGIADAQHRASIFLDNIITKFPDLYVSHVFLEDFKQRPKPINTKLGTTFVITNRGPGNNLKEMEICIDENDFEVLSFLSYETAPPRHYVIKSIHKTIAVDNMIDNFFHNKQLPTLQFGESKLFLENGWSEESIEWAKS